jgi:uncharacterized small protein (DUF1192 family)
MILKNQNNKSLLMMSIVKKVYCRVVMLLLMTSFIATASFAQYTYQIQADSVRIYNTCDTAELIIENHTQDTLGFLFNTGKGRTEFRKLKLQTVGGNSIAITGQDTLMLGTIIKTAVDTIYTSGGLLYYRKTDGNTVTVNLDLNAWGDERYDLLSTNYATLESSRTWDQWPLHKVVGYNAYNVADMPSLSDQSLWADRIGSKNYYAGLLFRTATATGYDIAINWDGEEKGPNGMFVRSKDDTHTAWSAWRELLFKDYADNKYMKQADGNKIFDTLNLYVRGGVNDTLSIKSDWNTLVKYSYMGSVYGSISGPVADNSDWWNLISVRHRNGITKNGWDGNKYGMQIASGMTGGNVNRIFFRNDVYSTWTSWKEFWHSGNVTFATKGANVALKTDEHGVLAVESWIRTANNMGLSTPDGSLFYRRSNQSWGARSATGTDASWIEFETGEGTSRGGVYGDATGLGFVNVNAQGWRLRTDASGNAYVSGQVYATGFYQNSLRSLKKDIQPFNAAALNILSKAQVRSFVYKADSANTKHIGFVADELPDEMAAPKRDGVDEANTVALLVKALQEMNAKVEMLQQQIEKLQQADSKKQNNKQ